MLHPAYIRSFALLCALKHAHGNESKRLPVILHIVTQKEGATPQNPSGGGGDRSLLYACTPNADSDSPDIFPYVLSKMVVSGYQCSSKKNLSREIAKKRRKKKKRRNLPGGGEEDDSENEEKEDGEEEEDEGETVESSVRRQTLQGRPGITRDGGCPYMIHVGVGRGLGADIQRQVAALYLREVRRRAEEEVDAGSEVEEEEDEDGVSDTEEDRQHGRDDDEDDDDAGAAEEDGRPRARLSPTSSDEDEEGRRTTGKEGNEDREEHRGRESEEDDGEHQVWLYLVVRMWE